MKKNYLLIFSGLIPLSLLVFLVYHFGKDKRYKIMQSAKLITPQNISEFQVGELALVHGKITNKETFSNGFVAYQIEEKVKEKDRSIWKTKESHIPSLIIDIGSSHNITINVDDDSVLCGGLVQIQKIPEKDPKKYRILGLTSNTLITAYGKVVSISPFVVHVGKSLCAENLAEYEAALSKKSYAYTIAILFLAIPSLFLVYLGLFRAEG